MTKLFDRTKKSILLLALGLFVATVFWSNDSFAAKKPNCVEGVAAAQACKCGPRKTCDEGETCISSKNEISGSGDYVYRCSKDTGNLKNYSSSGLEITVVASNSSDFDDNDECKQDDYKCSPACQYRDMVGKCTFCPLFATAFRAASIATYEGISKLSGHIYKVIIIGFAVWLALQVLAFVTALETRDLKDFVLSLMTQSFIVIIVLGLLQSNAFSFLNDFLNPIFNTGMRAAQTILRPDDIDANSKAALSKIKETKKESKDAFVPEKFSCEGLAVTYGLPPTTGNAKVMGALPVEMGEGILCTMGLIQQRAAFVKALGSSGVCYSWQHRQFYIFPHLNYLLTGLGFWIGGMVILLAVPFMMVDSVLELAIAGILIPFAIGAYAFKITRKYTGKIWETFMNSMFAFVFIALIALMVTVAFEQIITSRFEGNVDGAMTLTQILKDHANVNPEKLFKAFAWHSGAFLEVCFVLILAWAVIGEAGDFAKQFAGSISSTKIGSSIGTMAASAAKSAAINVTQKTAESVWENGSNLVMNTGASAIGGIRNGWKNHKVRKAMRKSGGVPNANGEYTFKNWRGRTITAKQTKDGDYVVTETKVKKNKDGSTSTYTKIRSDTFNVTTSTKTLKDGTVVYSESVQANHAYLKNIIDEKGAVNEEKYKKALESIKDQPEEEQKRLMVALQKHIVSKQIPHHKLDMEDHSYVSQNVITDDDGNVIGFEEVHADGSKTFVDMRFDKDSGRMMINLTSIDKKGNGKTLSTDGVINRKRTFKIDGDVDLKDVNSENLAESIDEDSVKTAYAFSAYYEYYNKAQDYYKLDRGLKTSAFDAEEVQNASAYARAGTHGLAQSGMYEFKHNK